MRKLRAINQQNAIRLLGNDTLRRLSDTQNKTGKILEDRTKAHQSNFMRIEKAFQSALGQMLAANANDVDQPVSLAAKSINQVGTK